MKPENEYTIAWKVARSLLDDHTRDPDGDFDVLARCYVRLTESLAAMHRLNDLAVRLVNRDDNGFRKE